MYTLRVIEETRENEKAPFECVVVNHSLGECYAFYDSNTKRFKDECPKELKDDFVGFVSYGNCGQIWIAKSTENCRRSYYVMTESGKTFEKL